MEFQFNVAKCPSPRKKGRILESYDQSGSARLINRWVHRTVKRDTLHATDIARWKQKFRGTGNLDHRRGNGRPRVSEKRVQKVKQMCQENPRLRIRTVSSPLNQYRSTIRRLLRIFLILHRYKMQNSHFIRDSDPQSRLNFAHYCQNHPDGYSNILFIDEAVIRLNVYVSSQNVRNLGTERLFEGNLVPLHSSGSMSWCGSSKESRTPLLVRRWNRNRWFLRTHFYRKVFPNRSSLEREQVSSRMKPVHTKNLHYVLTCTENSTINKSRGKAQ